MRRFTSLKGSSKLVLVGIFLCVLVLVHLEIQLAHLVRNNEEDERKLSDLEVEVDEVKRFNYKTQDSFNKLDRRELTTKLEVSKSVGDTHGALVHTEETADAIKRQTLVMSVTTTNITLLKDMFRQRYLVRNGVKELWWHLRARLRKMKASGSVGDIDNLLGDLSHQEKTIMADLDKLEENEAIAAWKRETASELAKLVQARFHYMQNPKDCKSARKLICELTKPCGYGCQIHHIGMCFTLAYATERVMILHSNSWQYSDSRGWEAVFMPLSETCVSTDTPGETWRGLSQSALEVKVPIIEMLNPRPPQLPMAIPRDLADKMFSFHAFPYVWWAGQMFKYILRPNKEMTNYIDRVKKEIGFRKPIVGIHVRRTDKVGTEAAFHDIEEYMEHVEEWYMQREITTGSKIQKRVFLATDDPNVLSGARKKYPDYDFCSDVKISKSASTGNRYSTSSLFGVVFDIEMLAMSDYIVCTFSSQVCRLAYELMQQYHVDASEKYYSLDDVYYYGGMQAHHMQARYPHTPLPGANQQHALVVGDTMSIAGNEKDGTSKATLHRTGKYGEYLSYKVEEVFRIEDFPLYEKVKV